MVTIKRIVMSFAFHVFAHSAKDHRSCTADLFQAVHTEQHLQGSRFWQASIKKPDDLFFNVPYLHKQLHLVVIIRVDVETFNHCTILVGYHICLCIRCGNFPCLYVLPDLVLFFIFILLGCFLRCWLSALFVDSAVDLRLFDIVAVIGHIS